jgi:hypothetical protein
MALTTAGERCHRAKSVFSGGEHATAVAPNAKSPARYPPGFFQSTDFAMRRVSLSSEIFSIVCTGGIACDGA